MGRRPNKRKFINTTKIPRVKRKYTRRVQSASIVPEHAKLPTLHYAEDGDRFRVWREDWPGDMFEVMNAEQFSKVQYVAARFTIQLKEHDLVSDED